ncbi:MAG: T9SS type A sorting domain-containing protein [Bacteroidota bacterium]
MVPRLRLVLPALALLLGGPVLGQAPSEIAGPIYAHALPDAPRPDARTTPPVVVQSRGAAATFEVIYTGFPAQAQAAFQRAVDLWADFVVSAVPIRVNAEWVEFDSETTLGAAGPFIAQFDEGDSRPAGFEANVWYPIALLNSRAGRDVAPGSPDISAEFNAAFNRWHFGTGAPGPSQFDFTTVVLHELAHGLGFIGGLTVERNEGTLVSTSGNRDPFAFDLLARDCDGNRALDETLYPRPSRALRELLTGEALFLTGPTIDATTDGTPTPLYAPTSWNPGSSYSHFNESTFSEPSPQSLMTPFFVQGERILSPGALTCAVMEDLGWELAGECLRLLSTQSPVVIDLGSDACVGTGPSPPTPNPTIEVFRLDDFGPRLVRSGGQVDFTISFGNATIVDVRIYDTLGRLYLARRFAEEPQTTSTGSLDLGGLSLPSGQYYVAFSAQDRQVVEKISVIR